MNESLDTNANAHANAHVSIAKDDINMKNKSLRGGPISGRYLRFQKEEPKDMTIIITPPLRAHLPLSL
jgi:hypothetical protein